VGGQPGVVHQAGHLAQLGRGVEELRHGILIGDLSRYREGPDAGRAGGGGDLLGGSCIAQVPDDEVVPAPGQMNCGGCSNAAAATSDDGQRSRGSWHAVILPHSLGPTATREEHRHLGNAALGCRSPFG